MIDTMLRGHHARWRRDRLHRQGREKDEATRTVRVELQTRNQAGETKLSGDALIALAA